MAGISKQEIYDKAFAVTGSKISGLGWLVTPRPEFNNMSAIDYMAKDKNNMEKVYARLDLLSV